MRSTARKRADSKNNENEKIFIIVSRLVSVLTNLVHILFEPVHEQFGDASAILLGHHLVTIAREANIFQVYVGGLHARLIEPLGCAMRIRTVIACFAGHVENWDALHVYELVRRLGLNPAWNKAGTVGLFLAHRTQFSGLFDGRVVVNRKIVDPPKPGRTGPAPLGLFNRR